MKNFEYECTTKIIFGKDTEQQVGTEIIVHGKKVLLVYGGGSIKKTGLYSRVTAALRGANVTFTELSGVEPNPKLGLVKKGIKVCKEEKIDALLAVGGGSVIDTAKAIAAGSQYDGDVWDFFEGKADIKSALPVGVILTIPAAGSETSTATIITNEDGGYKRSANSNLIRPVFAILNPELTFTVSKHQTAAGSADIMSHVFERYFTKVQDVDVTDRLCEAVLRSLIENIPIVMSHPTDYAARAEIMWAGTLAHNDLLGTGRVGDWGSHMIAHEISGLYDLTHGATLSIVFPAWMKYVYKQDIRRFAQYANKVWGIEPNYFDLDKTALKGIQKTKEFFTGINLPVSLKDADISPDKIDEMASKCTEKGPVGNFVKLYKDDVVKILELAQ